MKNITKWHILLIGVVILLLAGVSLWWGLCFKDAMVDKVLIVLVTVMLLFVSSIFLILFALSFGKRHNVFLYDKKTKREIDVEDLTFERICKFLDLYIGVAFNDKKNVYFSDFSNEDFLAPVPREYHCLFLMRLLSAWIEIGTDEQWEQFAQADKRNIDAVVDILFDCGEHVISTKLLYLRDSYIDDYTNIKEFFLSNLEYFREFILNYVKDNIHRFD